MLRKLPKKEVIYGDMTILLLAFLAATSFLAHLFKQNSVISACFLFSLACVFGFYMLRVANWRKTEFFVLICANHFNSILNIISYILREDIFEQRKKTQVDDWYCDWKDEHSFRTCRDGIHHPSGAFQSLCWTGIEAVH